MFQKIKEIDWHGHFSGKVIEYIITIAKNWALKGHPERYMYLSIAKMTMKITGYQPIHLNINT